MCSQVASYQLLVCLCALRMLGLEPKYVSLTWLPFAYLLTEEVHASKSASHVFHQMVSPRASIKSKEIKSAEMVQWINNFYFEKLQYL